MKNSRFFVQMVCNPAEIEIHRSLISISCVKSLCLIWKVTHTRSEKTEKNSRIGQSDTEGMPEIWAGIAESSTDFVRGNEKSLCRETQA